MAVICLLFTDCVNFLYKNRENKIEQMKNAQVWEKNKWFYQCFKNQLGYSFKLKNAIDYDLSLSHENLLFSPP